MIATDNSCYFAVPSLCHEQEAVEFIRTCIQAGEIHGANGLDIYQYNYPAWLEKLNGDFHRTPNRKRVPSETYFLVAQLPKKYRIWLGKPTQIIGIFNIRLCLNRTLRMRGGHIGYMIDPHYRRQGFAQIGLFLALQVCLDRGLEAALLNCYASNIAAAHISRKLGGKLLCEFSLPDRPDDLMQQYIVDLDRALAEVGSRYSPYIMEYAD